MYSYVKQTALLRNMRNHLQGDKQYYADKPDVVNDLIVNEGCLHQKIIAV
jgi:hypothetical protein